MYDMAGYDTRSWKRFSSNKPAYPLDGAYTGWLEQRHIWL